MRKDRSSIPSGEKPDERLPRERILRGKKRFQRLFSNHASQLRERYIDLRFCRFPREDPDYQMAFIVSRKLGKAARRNRMRRVMKEAFRKNQHLLADLADSQQITVHGALMAKTIDLPYEEAERNIISLLTQLRNRSLPETDTES